MIIKLQNNIEQLSEILKNLHKTVEEITNTLTRFAEAENNKIDITEYIKLGHDNEYIAIFYITAYDINFFKKLCSLLENINNTTDYNIMFECKYQKNFKTAKNYPIGDKNASQNS